MSEWNSNVLITGKSYFDDKKWATGQSCIRKEITSYRIGSLGRTFGSLFDDEAKQKKKIFQITTLLLFMKMYFFSLFKRKTMM